MGNNEISNNKVKESKKVIEEGPIFDKIWFLRIIVFSSFVTILFNILGGSLSAGFRGGGFFEALSGDAIAVPIFISHFIVLFVSFYLVIKRKNKRTTPLKKSVGAMLSRASVACVIIFTYMFWILIYDV